MGAIVQYYNLTGGLNTAYGIGTINQSNKRTESPDMQNVEFYKLGGLKSMEGNTQFSKTVLTAGVSLGHEYIYEDKKYLLVFTTDGDVWEYDRVLDEFVSLNTRLGLGPDTTAGRKIFNIPTPRFSAVNFNNGVVFTNGVEDLVYYKKNRHILTTGKVSGSQGGKIISGELTTFKTEIHKGDFITFGYDSKEYYIVEEITSDTALILTKELKSDITNEDLYIGELSFCNASMINSTNVTNEEEINNLIGTPIRGLALQSYQGRLWVGGTDGILYYSEVGLYNGWDIKYGAGNFPSFYNDTSTFSALALWDKVLVICKRERTYILDGTDSNDANWKIEPFSVNTVESQQSWIDCNNGLWGFSKRENGIYPILQRTIYNAFFGGNDLSLKISGLFDYINQAKYDEIFPVYHPKKGYIMFYIPLLTGIGSNDCFCYDTEAKAWLHRKVPQEVTSAFEFNNEVYIGTKDGKVLKEFFGLTFDGQPIEFYWKSPWFYFGDSSSNKTTKEFRVKISEEETNKFKVVNRRDGKDTSKSRTVDSNLGAFIGLEWDIGYQKEDLNSNYSTTRLVTKATDGKDTYYTPYTQAVQEATTLPLNTALFSDELCRKLETFVGIPYEWGRVYDISKADRLDPVTKNIYRFTYSEPEWKRYSNGTDYVWIPYSEDKPTVGSICKISKAPSTVLKGYTYPWVGYLLDNNGDIYIDTTKPQYQQTTRLQGYTYLNDKPVRYTGPEYGSSWTEGAEAYLVRDSSGRLYDGSPEMNYQTIYVKFKYKVDSEGNHLSNIEFIQLYKNEYRNASYTDWSQYYEATGEYTGSDISKAGDAIITEVVDTGVNGLAITTTSSHYSGLFYQGTDSESENYVYSYVAEGTTGEPLFDNTEMTLQVGEWNTITEGYNAIVKGDNANIISPVSMEALTYEMYGKVPLKFTKVDTPFLAINPWRYKINPKYDNESITDTVWDRDSWVVSRQITKRFPLPNQYFETMQVEFYGNADDEGMAIYGFEIDGVELEEVPFK